MSFQPSPPDPSITFTEDDKNEVNYVRGDGLVKVHFKDCNVTWFVRDSNGNTDGGTKLVDGKGEDFKSGWGTVPSGIDLYLMMTSFERGT